MIEAGAGLLCRVLCGLLCGLFAGLFAGLPPELLPELLDGVSSMIGACSEPTTAGVFCGAGLPCPCIGIVA